MTDVRCEELMKFFSFTHLPHKLAEVSEPFCILATELNENLPNSDQKVDALKRLLESKDCAVRATLIGMETA